ncbi:hypothetical protein M514_07637 [Trichuris suis]|uniref:Uncharacterized protein n=1 Tax=Trichuris suis TaxID=68888 RepID=A0A085M2H8_9BILA|nr:hypothetical protein M513_07637 [Trichuris suis]KFD65753.1 hypothetical protein M514_07637 [Trichuris suis]
MRTFAHVQRQVCCTLLSQDCPTALQENITRKRIEAYLITHWRRRILDVSFCSLSSWTQWNSVGQKMNGHRSPGWQKHFGHVSFGSSVDAQSKGQTNN